MAVSSGGSKKDLLRGKMASLVSTLRRELVTAKVGFSRRNQPTYTVRMKKGKPLGKVLWTVQSRIEPVSFHRKKDALAFAELLNDKATVGYNADIIRREIEDNGFILTHGEENV